MSTPKISIGMPVFNAEQFIRTAINSLLSQTYSDFELIISDNASTDNTWEICGEYAKCDSRIQLFRQEESIEVTDNFQYVLDKSVGEYFMWAAHDDWWDPVFIEKLKKILDFDTNVVIAFSAINHVDLDGHVFREYGRISELEITKEQNCLRDYLFNSSFRRYLEQNIIHGKVNLIYGLMRRDILCKARPVKTWGKFGWGADLLMVASILRYGDVRFSPAMLWRKMENPQSAGSLQCDGESSAVKSLVGVMGTLGAYLRYSLAIWKVQGRSDSMESVFVLERLFWVVYELIRSINGFFVQLIHATRKRLSGSPS